MCACAPVLPFTGAPGARRGPQGAENRPKNPGRIYHFILSAIDVTGRTETNVCGPSSRCAGASSGCCVGVTWVSETKHLPSLRTSNAIYKLYLVFGRFPAELGPETRSNGSGLKNGADRTQHWARRPILRPFRDHFLVRTHNSK